MKKYVLNNSYWTSTYGTNDDCFATVWTNGGYYGDDYRWAGYYIRPVYGQINYPIEYVDLGLSVNWATCNIGAIQPENTGDYFAWGETSTRSRYAGYGHGSYKYSKYENGAYHYTKYCVDSSYGYEGFKDGKTILESSDDAASILWDSEWRIPTEDEIHELRKNCTWTWTNQGGMNGYLVTSNISGYENSSIFLPAAGSRGTSEKTYMEGELGFYWSSTLNTSDNAYMLYLRTDGVYDYISHARYEGLTIRPVSQSNSWGGITKITLKYDSVYVLTNQEYNLRIDSLMSGDYDYSFLKVKWTSSNPDVATIDANGTISALGLSKHTLSESGIIPESTSNPTVYYSGDKIIDINWKNSSHYGVLVKMEHYSSWNVVVKDQFGDNHMFPVSSINCVFEYSYLKDFLLQYDII